jgi:glycosyltransferase involved in cell wall biosynthesis
VFENKTAHAIKRSLKKQQMSIDNLKRQGGLRTRGFVRKPFKSKPLISIITTVYNAVRDLDVTIQSVLKQSYENIEYIIIDGGSTDGTLDTIRRYEDKVDLWISEPDDGIYDAMNKGWSVANDESFVLFLGAGDKILNLPPDIKKSDMSHVIFGKVDLGGGKFFNSKADIRLKLGNTLHHQALLINKSLSPEPPFNTKYKIYADFDFNQRLLRQGVKFVHSDNFVSYFMPSGVTSRICAKELLRESASVVKKNFGMFWTILAVVYFLYQGIKSGFNRQSIKC